MRLFPRVILLLPTSSPAPLIGEFATGVGLPGMADGSRPIGKTFVCFANSPALSIALPIAYFDSIGLPRLFDDPA
jgi:hypothetical protein